MGPKVTRSLAIFGTTQYFPAFETMVYGALQLQFLSADFSFWFRNCPFSQFQTSYLLVSHLIRALDASTPSVCLSFVKRWPGLAHFASFGLAACSNLVRYSNSVSEHLEIRHLIA